MHVNVDNQIDDTDKLIDLINYVIKKGVVYWAINYKLQSDGEHMWVGSDICPKCGKACTDTYTRVVGFLTNIKNWNKVRRENDFPNRRFYSAV